MTHDEKLDRILNGLLSRTRKRIENKGVDDERLTMEFICNTLFEKKDHEAWETEFLKRRLLSDGLIELKSFGDNELPEITDLGIKFIQNGGYKKERFDKSVESELRVQNLKNAKRSRIALFISILSLLLSAIYTIVSVLK